MSRPPTQKGKWGVKCLKVMKSKSTEKSAVEGKSMEKEKQKKLAGGMQQELQDMGRIYMLAMRNGYIH